MPVTGDKDPPIFITEPLSSFAPQKLKNGDLRMAIAKAGQHAYSMSGLEATLTEEFLSRDFRTWEGGLVSINHEPNQPWVKAKLYNPEYDSESKLVICSFSGIPDWLTSLIYSEDYQGLSQECIPIEMKNGSMDVVKGYGTGVTIVTSPYNPAATQDMGVGIPPALAAILQSKYFEETPQSEDSMTEKIGGGTPAISTEAFESVVSEKAQLVSRVSTLESENKKLGDELASWKQKYTELESGETKRTEIAIAENRAKWEADLKATAERDAAVADLKAIMSEEAAKEYLATEPTIAQIKSITAIMRTSASKGVGSSVSTPPDEGGKSYDQLNSEWNARLGRT
jgi:hypothetical protein